MTWDTKIQLQGHLLGTKVVNSDMAFVSTKSLPEYTECVQVGKRMMAVSHTDFQSSLCHTSKVLTPGGDLNAFVRLMFAPFQAWDYHKKRNQSVIVDLFHGQVMLVLSGVWDTSVGTQLA